MSTANDTSATDDPAAVPRRGGPPRGFLVPLAVVPALLFGVPLWTVVLGGQGWPLGVRVAGIVLAVLAYAGLPLLMAAGHGRRRSDAAARVGDTLLGLAWLLFACSVLGLVLELVLLVAGTPGRERIVAYAVVAAWVLLVGYGLVEALRVPRVREREVVLDRLGPGLDGARVVVLTDTHFGPLDRTRWSERVAAVVRGLEPDLLVHAGDIADGDVARRGGQARPMVELTAPLGRFSIVGNHEHFSGAEQWVAHLRDLGWQVLVNAHAVVERGGDELVVAGVDDPAGRGRPLSGGPDLDAALTGAAPDLPVLLLAHQPSQVGAAVAAGVDLQVSGHTHGGQIWPFHLIVRLEQRALAGLSRRGERTQLYTSRGTGFWGPPLRVFAPSEITVLVLRAGR
ncbi:metallophosphoesterase [Pseudonocardia ailaonensis]|uniref:metallophosphoesterase n=1 Tax=Pseudonocardia ailaonensis TaxID=367279 RepID=UPI0031E0BEDE